MHGKNKNRELKRLAGVVALGTGILGLAAPAVGAVTPAIPVPAPAASAPAASVTDSSFEAVRRSGDAQAILAYIAQHPNVASSSALLMTLPKSVAREVHAGLAAALAKAQLKTDPEKPGEKAAAKYYQSPDGHIAAASQYEWDFEEYDLSTQGDGQSFRGRTRSGGY